jgi:hypothetical protein
MRRGSYPPKSNKDKIIKLNQDGSQISTPPITLEISITIIYSKNVFY